MCLSGTDDGKDRKERKKRQVKLDLSLKVSPNPGTSKSAKVSISSKANELTVAIQRTHVLKLF